MDDGRRTDDGRTPEHVFTISSPCEPEGSGELNMCSLTSKIDKFVFVKLFSIVPVNNFSVMLGWKKYKCTYHATNKI